VFIVAEYLRRARGEKTKVKFSLEQPASPRSYKPEVVSWWDTMEWKKIAEEFGFNEYTFNQGDQGGTAKKPTTFGGSLEMEIPEKRGLGSSRTEGPPVKSKDLARWSPGTMMMVAQAIQKEIYGVAPSRLAVMSWEEHLAFGHTPYRKDCLICQECQQKERPHRKLPYPRAGVPSLDCAGPLPVADDVNSQTAKFMLVGAFTWAAPKGSGKLKEPEVDESEENEDSLGFEEIEAERGEEEEGVQEDSEHEEDAVKEKEDEKKEEREEYEVRVFRMVTPLVSKQGQEVLRASMEFILRLKMDGYYVNQVHTDQGGEFGHHLRRWLKNRGIMMTRTPGDSPQSNGRAEVAVQAIKVMVRKALRQAGVGVEWWPWAVRYVNELLRCYRLDTKPTWPHFLQEVHTKKRHWKARDLEPTMEVVRYLAPAWEEHGHWILRGDPKAKPTVTRYVLQKVQTPIDDGVWVALEKELLDGLALRRRIRGKTTVKVLAVNHGEKSSEEGEEERQNQRMRAMKVIEEEVGSMLQDEEETFAIEAGVISRMKKIGDPTDEEEEVLQTRVVSPYEAAKEWDKWIPAADSEVGSLLEEKQALRPVSKEEMETMVKEAHNQGRGVQFLPSKIVLTRKPGKNGGKRKLRWVVCGNFEEKSPQEQTFAGGCDATSFRLMVHVASCMAWEGGTVDVRTAFLNASMNIKEDEDLILIKPPSFLVDRKYMKKEVCYEPLKAVYGFRRSPRLWGDLRDETLKEMDVKTEDGTKLKLCPLQAEPNLWKIVYEKDGEEEYPPLKGLFMTYVDDIFVCGESLVVQALMKAIRKTWATSEPDCVGEKAIKFLGMDISKRYDEAKKREVWFISQESYIKDMLEKEEIRERTIPISKDQAAMEKDESEIEEKMVKAAQKEVGELLWLVTRTRPDLCFSVARLSSNILKNPKKVVEVAKQTKGYIEATMGEGLCFEGDRDQAQLIHAYSDASFAPDGQESHGCVIICIQGSPVFWRSGRQSMITLSTAEAELMELVEGLTAGESVYVIAREIFPEVAKIGWCDSQSAISVLVSEGGSWRTHHLRLRSNFARQAILAGEWSVHHVPGVRMIADLGTKALTSGRMKDLKDMMGLKKGPEESLEESSEAKKDETEKKEEEKDEGGSLKVKKFGVEIHEAKTLVQIIALAASIQATRAQGEEEEGNEDGMGLIVMYTMFISVTTILIQFGVRQAFDLCLRRRRVPEEEEAEEETLEEDEEVSEERRVEGEERRVEGEKKEDLRKAGRKNKIAKKMRKSDSESEEVTQNPTASSSNAQNPSQTQRSPDSSSSHRGMGPPSPMRSSDSPLMSGPVEQDPPPNPTEESFEAWLTRYGEVYHLNSRCGHLKCAGHNSIRKLELCRRCRRMGRVPRRGERILVARGDTVYHAMEGCVGRFAPSYRVCSYCH